MPWFSLPHTLAYKILQVYIQTVDLYRRPTISSLFSQQRHAKYIKLLRELYVLLKQVHILELRHPRDDIDAPPLPDELDTHEDLDILS